MEIKFDYDQVKAMLRDGAPPASMLMQATCAEEVVSGIVADVFNQAVRQNVTPLWSISRYSHTLFVKEPGASESISGHVLVGFDENVPELPLVRRHRKVGSATASWQFSPLQSQELPRIKASLRRLANWGAFRFWVLEFTAYLPESAKMCQRAAAMRKFSESVKATPVVLKRKRKLIEACSARAQERGGAADNSKLHADLMRLAQRLAQLKKEVTTVEEEFAVLMRKHQDAGSREHPQVHVV